MFEIIATIIALAIGSPVGDPMRAKNRTTFASEAECNSFKTSEKGADALASLKTALDARIKPPFTYVVTVSCKQAADDGSL
jgi:hypothetical protein